jgi:sialic acid synthase SpsE
VEILRNNGCKDLSLLKCTSSYPAPPEEANLARIAHMAETFQCKAGLSDHTLGITVPVAAVALGASIIEKHFCRSRNEPGPDNAFSLEPAEFRSMVDAIRIAESAVGKISYELTDKEKSGLAFRRSLFVSKDIRKGEIFTAANVRIIRPSHGLSPEFYEMILGHRSANDIGAGTPLTWGLIQ